MNKGFGLLFESRAATERYLGSVCHPAPLGNITKEKPSGGNKAQADTGPEEEQRYTHDTHTHTRGVVANMHMGVFVWVGVWVGVWWVGGWAGGWVGGQVDGWVGGWVVGWWWWWRWRRNEILLSTALGSIH